MADEADETLDERLERGTAGPRIFATSSRTAKKSPSDSSTARCSSRNRYRGQFERKHAKLFGRMLSIETQMDAGLFPYFAGLILSGVAIFGLQLDVAADWLDAKVSDLLNRWWFYVALPLTMSFLMYLLSGQWEKWIYRRHREALAELIQAEKLDRDVMLVMLRDEDRDLTRLVHALKLDNAGVRSEAPG